MKKLLDSRHTVPKIGISSTSRGYVAMSSLIIAESAIFTIFVTAYLYYLGRDVAGPTPREEIGRASCRERV